MGKVRCLSWFLSSLLRITLVFENDSLAGGVCRHPAVEGGHRDAQVLGYFAGSQAVGQQAAGRVDFAVGHLAFAAADFAPLAGRGQAGVSAFERSSRFIWARLAITWKKKRPLVVLVSIASVRLLN